MSDQFMRIVEILLNSFWPLCKAALKYTIPLTIVSFGCGTVLAFITAIFRLSGVRILQGIAKFYIWIIRGTPLLVQLFVIFYGLPSLGIVLSPFVSGVLGLSLCQGAYNSEIVRAAILSVPSGQWEAAKALGMTRAQTYMRIVIPQAARTAVPSLGNQFIGLTKDTSLAGIFCVATANKRAAFCDTVNQPVPIERGSLIRFDYGCDYQGYTSDLSRTVCVGTPDEKTVRLYDAIRVGTEAAIAAACPGVRACELFQIAVETTRSNGIPHYRRHHVGHCLGLEVYDDPSITPDNQTVLQADMVLNIETPYYELGWGGVQVEDTVAITENGAVRLDVSDNHLIVLDI